MEDIFSSTNENPIRNDGNNQIGPSLIDQISSQDDEIRVSKSPDERLIVGQSRSHEGQRVDNPSPALINEVFQDPDEDIMNMDMSKTPEEGFAYEDEKEPDRGQSLTLAGEKGQQFDPNTQQRTPSNYEQGNTSFKSGMHTFSRNCILYSQPEISSEPWKVIKSGKQLWLDKFNDQWYKAYRSDNDPVFLQAECLN